MNTGTKLAGFGLVLAAMVGGGAAVGAVAGPIDVGTSGDHGGGHAASDEPDVSSGLPAGGLLVSQDGFTFSTSDRVLDASRAQPFSFVIDGPDGAPLESYELLHERELHLIVVSSDLGEFVHVHPTQDAEGTWSVELPALSPGAYRAYADFQPTGGEQLTLGTDLTVPGPLTEPAALSERRSVVVDGYEVALDGDPGPNGSSTVTLTVRRAGEVVTTEPYLGAAGHLVAIRDGDLAYLHVHPIGDEPEGPVQFAVEVPSAGTYGLFFDFAHDGEVRTANFVIQADAPETPAGHDEPNPPSPTTTVGDDDGHGH